MSQQPGPAAGQSGQGTMLSFQEAFQETNPKVRDRILRKFQSAGYPYTLEDPVGDEFRGLLHCPSALEQLGLRVLEASAVSVVVRRLADQDAARKRTAGSSSEVASLKEALAQQKQTIAELRRQTAQLARAVERSSEALAAQHEGRFNTHSPAVAKIQEYFMSMAEGGSVDIPDDASTHAEAWF